MIAVDINVMVYAGREGSPRHEPAYAQLSELCRASEIGELGTADRDFNRFPKLKSFNPLMEWVNPGPR